MKEYSIKKELFTNQDLVRMIVPLVIEQILVMLVGMVDTVMITYAGEAAVSGVALVDMINYLFTTILASVATGGAVIISQYMGKQDKAQADMAAGQLFMIAGLASSAIAVLCLAVHKQILAILYGSVEADVMASAVTYFAITAMSFPFLGIYNAAAALFRSMKKTNTTMYVSLLMNGINVVGNYIGIFILQAGVAGAAAPTLVARTVAAVVMVYLSMRPEQLVSVTKKSVMTWDKEMVQRILHVAVPNGIENGLFALGKVLVVSIVALFGTIQIAANGVANSISCISIVVVNSMNHAVVTVAGQCIGADEHEMAARYVKKMMGASYLATTSLGAIVIAALPIFRSFYDVSDATWSYVCILVVMHDVFAAMLHPTSFNLPNSLRAAGDVKFTMFVGIASMIIFRLGSATLFGIILNLGVIGVWIAMGMDWLARSVAFTFRFKSGKWKQFKIT